MGEKMRFKGRRALVTGLSLEPGQIYDIEPLDRKFGREGFWVEISNDEGSCTRPYENADEFMASWEGLPAER